MRGLDMPPDFDYRPFPTDLERLAFNELPVPGEMFTRNRIAKQQQTWEPQKLARNNSREVCHNLVVSQRRIDYNDHGWHDRHGHLYHLEADGDPAERSGPDEPLFFRAQHGQIVNMTLRNALPQTIEETEFDHAFPPCPALPWEGECAPHVHMVKFDPICADGASVGWNYMSGARIGRKRVYRWWADQEFGTIFFHDHLFANYRQKHGLFGALIVEPAGSTFFHHLEPDQKIVSGLQALIQRHPDDDKPTVDRWFREFCVGIADFIPMWDGQGRALNPPPRPGGHGDQGVMALNYRNAPLRERPGDPAFWFSSRVHGDPPTTVFQTYAHDPIWIRIVQGSHEESHSFQAHGLRWQRFRDNVESAVRNQQTTGIAEAFTFINRGPVRPGDYLYKLSGADDLWLGCWGLIRAHQRPAAKADRDLIALQPDPQIPAPPSPNLPKRTFWITAEPVRLKYRDDDLVDPYGLVYRLDSVQAPGGSPVSVQVDPNLPIEPLVLWCREGEQVVVHLRSNLPAGITTEPFAPEVPVERERPVSRHVSVHADLVVYDVRTSDGANVGLNPVQSALPTTAPGYPRTYTWDTRRPPGAKEPIGPVLLQDMADVRNHRHHGLIGALVVLAHNATPHPVKPGQSTSTSSSRCGTGRESPSPNPAAGPRRSSRSYRTGYGYSSMATNASPCPTLPRRRPAKPSTKTRAKRESTTAANRSANSTHAIANTASTTRSPPPRSGTCAKAGAYGSTSSAPWTSPAPTASPSTASPGPNTASNPSPAQPRLSPPSPRSPAARHAPSNSRQPKPGTTLTGRACSSGPSGKACGESCVSLTSGLRRKIATYGAEAARR